MPALRPERRGGYPPDRASLYLTPDARFGLARCCSWAADEAEAVLVDAAGAVAGGEEMQQCRKELDVSPWPLPDLIRGLSRAWGTGPLPGSAGQGRRRRARAGRPGAPAYAGWGSASPCLRFAVARRGRGRCLV